MMNARRILTVCLVVGALVPSLSGFARAQVPAGNSVEHVGLEQLDTLSDQRLLAQVAIAHRESAVRLKAVERLTEQAALLQVAMADTDEDRKVRRAAVRRMTDPVMLSEVITNVQNVDIGLAARTRLGAGAVVRNPSHEAVGHFRVSDVAKIADQSLLVRVATTRGEQGVRRAAVARLTDEAALVAVATTDTDWMIRVNAVARLRDQTLLRRVATTVREGSVRKAAIAKLDDQTVMSLATTDSDVVVRWDAVEKLTDQVVLARVAIGDADSRLREITVERLTDQAALARVAVADGNDRVRTAAVRRLTVEGVSAAAQATDSQQRAMLRTCALILDAARSVPDQHRQRVLTDVLPLAMRYTDESWASRFGVLTAVTVGWSATTRTYQRDGKPAPSMGGESISLTAKFAGRSETLGALWNTPFPFSAPLNQTWKAAAIDPADALVPWLKDDQGALARLAVSDPLTTIRLGAVRNLTDQALLGQMATGDREGRIRAAAVERLNDEALLERIAAADKDNDVQAAVRARMRTRPGPSSRPR